MGDSALAEVAFCADPTWANSSDPYHQANKKLLQNVLLSKATEDNLRDKMPPSSEDKCSGGLGAKTVRDVIPSSRLATYGNYEYDQVLESLYAKDYSSTEYHFDSTKSGTQEPWMLPEVEDLFLKYTAPSSSGASGFASTVKNTNEIPGHPTSQARQEHDIETFFQDKCTIKTESEIALAKRIRCDAVKRLWDTPFPDARCTRRHTNLQPPPRKQTATRLDTQIPTQYFLARQYQLWGSKTDLIPVPASIRDNPNSLFEYNELPSSKKPAYFFPSSSEINNSGELFPYLQEGLPIPTHTPSYAIPVIQSSQQTRSHSSGSPPAAKRIPVYQRPVEQQPERRRHGADLSNLICLSKHEERRTEEEPPPPGVDADPEISSDINWLLLHYHPRVTTFQQSSHLADELLVIERQMDEVVAMATVALEQSPESPVAPSACVKLELEKDFPPIDLSQKRVKSKKRTPGLVPTPMAEICVDVSGVWGPRKTYKDACLNETQLSPDSAGGFGNEVDDEYYDDEPLPDSIPDSFWAPVVKDDLEHWPALADTSQRRSPFKQEEMKDEDSDMFSIKETKMARPGYLEMIEEVQEVAVEEKKLEDAVGVVAQIEAVVARRSDEDLANKYQGLKEQALETIAVIRRGDYAGQTQEESVDDGVDDDVGVVNTWKKPTLLDVPRLGKPPSVDVGESSSDDESPLIRWSAPTSEGGYVVAVDVEPRVHRRPSQCPIPASTTTTATNLNSSLTATLSTDTLPCTSSLPIIVSADAVDATDADESTISRVSSCITLPDDTTAPSTKPAWLKQPRKKPPGRRKQSKPGTKPKPDKPACCSHPFTATDRNALVKIERELKERRGPAGLLLFRCVRRFGNRCDACVGTDCGAHFEAVPGAQFLSLIDSSSSHELGSSLKTACHSVRTLKPPECSVCLGQVTSVLERIREHVTVMDGHVWDELSSRLRAVLSHVTRLGEMKRAPGTWDCEVDRYSHCYEVCNKKLVTDSSSFLEAFLPALSFSYHENTYAPRNGGHPRKESVSLHRSAYISPNCTMLVGYLTSTCEDGARYSSLQTTILSWRGISFSRLYEPIQSLRAHEITAWSALARLESALNHFLRSEGKMAPTFIRPGINVGTQTSYGVGKNSIKALSKQLFQHPPPAIKKNPPAPPKTQPCCNDGVGQGDAVKLGLGKQVAPNKDLAGRSVPRGAKERSALAKKNTPVSHIPVPTRVRKRTGEPEITIADPETTKSQPDNDLSTQTAVTSDQTGEQNELGNFQDASVPASNSGSCAKLKSSVACGYSNPRQPPPTPTPTSPRSVPCGTPPSRKSYWLPEPLRQATARLFKRAARKQLVNSNNGGGVRPDAEVIENSTTSPGSVGKKVKKRMITTMNEIQKLKRDNAEIQCMLTRCSMPGSLGDRPGASRKVDDVGNGREGNGDAATTAKISLAVASPVREEGVGPQQVGERGDCDR